ncbi:MAG: Eco57I restriction-modification methylase domain-containing protein [Bacillota bacterium]
MNKNKFQGAWQTTFSLKFKIENLSKLIEQLYNTTTVIEEINCSLAVVNCWQRIKLKNNSTIILALELKEELGWTFKLRKNVANYLKKEQAEEGLVAIYNAKQKQWCWSIVKREELSSYSLNCYSIPIVDELSESSQRKLQQSLLLDNLEELIADFSGEVEKEFVKTCRTHYSLFYDKLVEVTKQLNLKKEFDFKEIAQKILIQGVIIYILKQRDLLRVKFVEQEQNNLVNQIERLANWEVLDFFIEGNNCLIIPSEFKMLQGFWDILTTYQINTVEEAPWNQILAVGPEILANLKEELLPSRQRKKSGVFYTPTEIVHYISRQAIIQFLETEVAVLSAEQIQDLVQERNLAKLDQRILPEVYQALNQLRGCDPAVGSGAFALGLVKELARIKEIIVYLVKDQTKITKLKTAAVQNSIYCMDIDTTAVAITKLRLWLWTGDNNLSVLADLEYKVVVTNPLWKIERSLEQRDKEMEAARDKYYKQQDLALRQKYYEEFRALKAEKLGLVFSMVDYFPKVFKKGGFDIVIGNPPYIGEKGNKEIFRKIRKYALRDFYNGKMDIFYFFFHLGLDIVREQGTVALITTDYYLTATGAYKLRADLQQRAAIKELIDFNNLRLFPAAIGQHNLITILKKNNDKSQSYLAQTTITYREGDAGNRTLLTILAGQDQQSNYYSIPQDALYQGQEKYLRLEVGQVDDLLAKVKLQGENLDQLCEINQGLVSGCDRVSPRHIRNYDLEQELKGRGIFVLSAQEAAALNLQEENKDLLRPWYKNSDIKQYWCSSKGNGEHILYLDQQLTALPQKIKDYLTPVREVLEDRREVKAGRLLWWQLQWSRREEMFAGPKLVVPQRSKKNTFAYNEEDWYASADVYYITKAQEGLKLKYLLALLNSELYYLWLYYKGKKKGALLELYQRPLSKVPIKVINQQQQQVLIDLVENLENKKQNLVQCQQLYFLEIKNQFQLVSSCPLQELIKENENYEVYYEGQASIVRELTIKIKNDRLVVYSAKSSGGDYKLFSVQVQQQYFKYYLKYYLENLTCQQLEEINQSASSDLVTRVQEIMIPGWREKNKVQNLVEQWQGIMRKRKKLRQEINNLQSEIDYLVYNLYQFTTDEIEFLTNKALELKEY